MAALALIKQSRRFEGEVSCSVSTCKFQPVFYYLWFLPAGDLSCMLCVTLYRIHVFLQRFSHLIKNVLMSTLDVKVSDNDS